MSTVFVQAFSFVWLSLWMASTEAFSVSKCSHLSHSSSIFHTSTPPQHCSRTILALSSSSLSSSSSSSSSATPNPEETMIPELLCGRPIRRTLTLVDAATDQLMAQGYELEPLPEERNKPDEDELEILYPTQRQYFQFGETVDTVPGTKTTRDRRRPPVQQVRSTSFGCSRMGHQVWPSSMALCLSLIHTYYHPGSDAADKHALSPLPRSVLELGAGCGLPSIVCRDVLQIPSVVATDFWYTGGKYDDMERETGRLIPEVWHGINLAYNVERNEAEAGVATKVLRADWHDLETVRHAAAAAAAAAAATADGGAEGVDLVIGSDLIYYGMDVKPFWNTIETLLQDCGASKVILISPLKETRESLPVFLELLHSKTDSRNRNRFQLQRDELHMYKHDEDFHARHDADRFVKLTLTKVPTNDTDV